MTGLDSDRKLPISQTSPFSKAGKSNHKHMQSTQIGKHLQDLVEIDLNHFSALSEQVQYQEDVD
jgi:hypothetical protein